jgi:hypothetical protein
VNPVTDYVPNRTNTIFTTIELKKRKTFQIPPWIEAFASSEISSACSCFITPLPPTIVNTQIVSTTVSPTTTIDVAGSTITDYITATVVESTAVITTVTSLLPSTTDVLTTFTTETSTTLPSPVCSSGAQIIKNPSFEQESGGEAVDWSTALSGGFEPVVFDLGGDAYSGTYAM